MTSNCEGVGLSVVCLREMIIALLRTVGVADCARFTSGERVFLSRVLGGGPSFCSLSGSSRDFAPFAKLVASVVR